jgi:hypothetical protein
MAPRTRVQLIRSSAAVLVSSGLLLLAGCSGDQTTQTEGTSPTAGATSTTGRRSATTGTVASDQLQVVESGLSPAQGPTPGVNTAAIIENPTQTTAVGATLHAEFVDDAGRVLDTRDGPLNVAFRPGRSAILVGGPAGTASVRITLTASDWRAEPASELSVSDVNFEKVSAMAGDDPGTARVDVTGTVTNHSSQPIEAMQVYAVVRDSGGEIIGGASGLRFGVPPQKGTPFTVHSVGLPDTVATVEAYPVVVLS